MHRLQNGPRPGISRRGLLHPTGAITAGRAGAASSQAPTSGPTPEGSTRLGVRPFINCTATLTINGGSLMLPEAIAPMGEASHFHVNVDGRIEKASARPAGVLPVAWA